MRFLTGLILAFVCSVCSAQSAHDYAAEMNRTRNFGHDPNWRGAEVIYQSSGMATEESARRWWMNSPRHRALLVCGSITEIACVGNYCVGRGQGVVGGRKRWFFR